MKNVLIFIGGVAVGILAVTGVYALDEEGGSELSGENEDRDDLGEESVDDRLEELMEPDGS
ncbi:hypothetical protein [Maridesulfovibrio bastinii]|uniref:hypothetical protein n=1 Tax=Maridesulfovibrio bastinii TaxID=47157 RepID=UPI000404AB86|nr:hypothetical protein [Maridesulfovibrio bastinii]